jgi:hypothetical protein
MALNSAMQDFMREWSARSARQNRPTMHDQGRLAWFAELNRGLCDSLDDEAFRARMRHTTRQLAELANEIVFRACADSPGLDASAVLALIGSRAGPVPAGMLVESAA